MIGFVTFRIDPDGPPLRAELADDGIWHCTDEKVAASMNLAHSPRDAAPSDGRFGARSLAEAALVLGGRMTFHAKPIPRRLRDAKF